MSPLARTIDWLSYDLGLLFVVSAGNQTAPLQLELARGEVQNLTEDEWEAHILRSALHDAHVRRLLSPAETLNGVSVGRTHGDGSGDGPFAGQARNSLHTSRLAAHTSAFGPGFRRSVKPEVTFDGGRQWVEIAPGPDDEQATVTAKTIPTPPGQVAAAPGFGASALGGTVHIGGTSNAAALTTRALVAIRDNVADRFDELGQPPPNRRVWVSLLKALAAHGSAWGDEAVRLEEVYGLDWRETRSAVARSLGYGWADYESSTRCHDQRATLLGWGELDDGEAHEFRMPIPQALSGQPLLRRLILTLAWLSPIHAGNRLYRGAQLWFNPPTDELGVHRNGPDWQAVQRGTLQHEVLVGDRPVAIADSTIVTIQVNCRSDAAPLDAEVPYGLAVTLEVDEGIDIPIYEQIEVAIRPEIRVEPGTP